MPNRTHKMRKLIGGVLIFLGIAFAIPFNGTPDDGLNFLLAWWFSQQGYDFNVILLLTYTVLPIILIYIGASIYPYKTSKVIVSKLKIIWGVLKNPIVLVLTTVLSGLLIFHAIGVI